MKCFLKSILYLKSVYKDNFASAWLQMFQFKLFMCVFICIPLGVFF